MATKKPYDEKLVLELLAQGSEYGFLQLMEHYRGRVFRVGMRYLKSKPLAEEIVQEVFLRIWNKRKEMKQVLRFEGYIIATTRNIIQENMRVLALEEAAEREFSYWSKMTSESELPEGHYQKLLHAAMEYLTPDQKRIFHLTRIEGLSQETVARQLNISRLTVKKHVQNALNTIYLQLKNQAGAGVFVGVMLEIFRNS